MRGSVGQEGLRTVMMIESRAIALELALQLFAAGQVLALGDTQDARDADQSEQLEQRCKSNRERSEPRGSTGGEVA